MQIELTPELEQYVRSKVESGEYRSASEVVRHALRLLSREDQKYEARLAALRGELAFPTRPPPDPKTMSRRAAEEQR